MLFMVDLKVKLKIEICVLVWFLFLLLYFFYGLSENVVVGVGIILIVLLVLGFVVFNMFKISCLNDICKKKERFYDLLKVIKIEKFI